MDEHLGLCTVLKHCLEGYAEHHRLDAQQWRVCRHVLSCRTEALGGQLLRCGTCGTEVPWYHACRDRHCPRCGRAATAAWCARERDAVLPVTYHHLVFTLPHALNPWVELHPGAIYDGLFEAVSTTLKAFGADPKRLDGQIGATVVLHTWGQNLTRHVHLHCLVPGGALQRDGHWKAARSTYLFPVRALSRHYRGHLVSGLRRAWTEGKLPRIADAAQVKAMLDALMAEEWVVYSKPAIQRTDTLIDYLGRYTHRTALSDSRILAIDEDDTVALRWKDYRDHDRVKVLHLDGEELIRRFLLHVLPPGFMRVRHYGFLANRCRAQRLKQVRAALEAPPEAAPVGANGAGQAQQTGPESPAMPCPRCGTGRLRPAGWIAPRRDDGGGG